MWQLSQNQSRMLLALRTPSARIQLEKTKEFPMCLLRRQNRVAASSKLRNCTFFRNPNWTTEFETWNCRNLSKAETHASRMQQFGFLAPGVKIKIYRNRRQYLKAEDICYCKDIPNLFNEFNQSYDPKEWILFINDSKVSLKAVLLHKRNTPSIPIAHAINTKETFEIIVQLLQLINYKQHNWQICPDLKFVVILCGLQEGWTKYCHFVCEWDSRSSKEHYVRNSWAGFNHHIGK